MSRRSQNVVTIAIALTAITVGIGLSARPWRVYLRERAQADAARKTMRQAEAARADLLRRQAEATSSVGRERMARDFGYVRPGEVPADFR